MHVIGAMRTWFRGCIDTEVKVMIRAKAFRLFSLIPPVPPEK